MFFLVPAIDQSSRPAATDDIFDQKPQLALQNALIKRVSSVLPSLSLKTGGTVWESINDQGEQQWSVSSKGRHGAAKVAGSSTA